MALYHLKAEKLKPLVEKASFTTEQLNLIHQMMRGCSQLRQGKVISSFMECMLPEDYEMKEGLEIEGKYGPYRQMIIVKKGDTEIVTQWPEISEAVEV